MKDMMAKAKSLLSGLVSKVKPLLTNLKIPKPDLKDPAAKKKFIFTVLIAVIAVIILARMFGNVQKALFKKRPEAAKKAAAVSFEEEATPVKVMKVKRTDFKDTLPAMGNIKGFKEIDLKFQVPGVLESFNFEEGERVQEGDIVASLVQRDALLKLKYSEVELNKQQKLFEIGAINQIKLDQAKLEYESAKSELDKTNIYAMSNGLLGSKLMDVGSYFNPSYEQRIGTFITIDKVYAEFNIIEKDIPKMALGQRAEVFVDAYPTKTFNGTVDRMAPIIEGRSRTEVIKVELENKDELLKPGMFVRALIATYEKKDALVIPASALKKKEQEYLVYVVNKEEPKTAIEEKPGEEKKGLFGKLGIGKKKEAPKPEIKPEEKVEYGLVEVRKVKVGYMTQDLVEIAEGLKEDELIIVEIQEELKDKSKVEIAEVQEGLI